MGASRKGFYTLEKVQLQPAYLDPLCAEINKGIEPEQ
jgi:hypothetical protein